MTKRTPARRSSHARLTAVPRRSGPFAPVEAAIAAMREGRIAVVVDDEDRENEGDFTVAAEKITPEIVNFMVTHGRGLVCLAMTPERLDALEIPLAVSVNSSARETAMCVPIDARGKTTTGISAADRAATILTAVAPGTRPQDLLRPGHISPLRARDGGVLVRAGHTEAAVDLARLAGLTPAGVICEIMTKKGSMARVPELSRLAKRYDLPLITIADLIQYRMRTERLVRRVASANLPTEYGEFRVHAYESLLNGETHVALVRGDIGDGEGIMVRVHSKCLTGDVFHSARCDCGPQLEAAMQRIGAEGRGVLLYLNQEGPRHRARQQDPRLRAAGPGAGHGRSQRAARLQGRPARLRHRRPDPGRPGRQHDAAPHQQPAQVHRPPGLRPCRCRIPPARDSSLRIHSQVHEDKEGQARAPAVVGVGPWVDRSIGPWAEGRTSELPCTHGLMNP